MTRAQDWAALADTAIAGFAAADTGDETPHAYAYAAGAIGSRSGWGDPRVQGYLDEVYERRNPDGGWGLNFAYDALGGGTVNPASTSYTVTVADHVGLVLVDAYLAGLVPLADIQALVTWVMGVQAFAFADGKCIAYSRHANDKITATNDHGVHNVSAHAARFLQLAQTLGAGATGLNRRIIDVTRHETAVYNPTTAWWPYRGDGAPADTDHTAAQAEAMYHLAYPLGREVAWKILSDTAGALDDNSMYPVALARLVGLPGGPAYPGSLSNVEPGATHWAVLGDAHMDTVAAFVASPPNNRARIQAAYWCARNAAVT